MSTTFEDIMEHILDTCCEEDEYRSTSRDALDELEKQEGTENFENKVVHWISELLLRMISDLYNERFQQRCTDLLTVLNHYVDVLHVMLRFVLMHRDDPSIVGFVFCLIKDAEFSYEYVDSAYSPILMDIMVRHENDPVVQVRAMDIIPSLRLDWSDEDCEWVLPVVLQAMRTHPDISNVQLAACNALNCIANPYNGPLLPILQAMICHKHCADVQASACDLLGTTLYNGLDGDDPHEEYQMMLTEREFMQPIFQAMETHSDNCRVQCSALDVLVQIAPYGTTTFNDIMQGGGVELVIRVLRLDGCDYYNAARVLDCVFRSSADARRLAIEGGAIPILLKAMEPGKLYSTRLLVEVLNHLFLENTDNSVGRQIASQGGIKPIVNASVQDNDETHTDLMVSRQLTYAHILQHLSAFASAEGMLPLHYAATWRTTTPYEVRGGERQLAVVEHLLAVYPEAVTIRDNKGRLPLHSAIEANAPLPVLEALWCANPTTGEALCHHEGDNMLNFPPALMAAVSDCHLDSIFVLLRYDPTIMKNQS